MPWHYCSKDTDDIKLLWGSAWGRVPRSFQKLLNSLPRPHPDPQLEWHLRLFDQYSNLKRTIEQRNDSPLLSERAIKRLNIIHGAPLDIDDLHPIDIEKRFFFAKRNCRTWAKQLARAFLKKGCIWSELEEKSSWRRARYRKSIRHMRHERHYVDSLWHMIKWLQGRTWQGNPWWICDQYHLTMDNPTDATLHEQVYRGRARKLHQFELVRPLVHRGRSKDGRDPSVPHAVIITYDTVAPDDRLLRSELLVALSVLRSNLALRPWLEHHTFPILVLSFHETGARVLQMHAENNRFVVRASRQLAFQTDDGSIPDDALVMLTWMMAVPMGDTSFPFLPTSDDTNPRQSERDPKVSSSLRLSVTPAKMIFPKYSGVDC
ncbi:hypothetical protein V8C26DRAFT_414019 [Trichoderma gracile]